MTRPTQQQIDGLKAGDRVLIETTFKRFGGLAGVNIVCEHAGYCTVHDRDTIHSILPREIKVGDRVRDAYGTEWEVVAGPRSFRTGIEFGLWSDLHGFGSGNVKDLTVIP